MNLFIVCGVVFVDGVWMGTVGCWICIFLLKGVFIVLAVKEIGLLFRVFIDWFRDLVIRFLFLGDEIRFF